MLCRRWRGAATPAHSIRAKNNLWEGFVRTSMGLYCTHFLRSSEAAKRRRFPQFRSGDIPVDRLHRTVLRALRFGDRHDPLLVLLRHPAQLHELFQAAPLRPAAPSRIPHVSSSPPRSRLPSNSPALPSCDKPGPSSALFGQGIHLTNLVRRQLLAPRAREPVGAPHASANPTFWHGKHARRVGAAENKAWAKRRAIRPFSRLECVLDHR